MKRDYTEDAYQQIKQTIEQIDNTDVSPVKDFFYDLLLRLGQYLEIFSVEQYQEDMQSWYDIVLDSHNTTMRTVDQIFNDVDAVDSEYRDIMDGALDSIISFQNTLNCLRDVISGKTSFADGKAAADGYLAAGKDSLNSAYDTILTQMEQKTLWDASKELFGDALKLGSDFASCVSAFYLRDPLKVAVSVKKLSDTVAATLFDLGALGSIVLLPPVALATKTVSSWFGIEISYESYLDTRFDQLMQAQGYKDTNSVSDWLGGIAEDMNENLEECPESNPYYPVVKAAADVSQTLSYTSKAVDTAVDLYDVVSDVKDVGEVVLGKNYTPDEFAEKYKDELPWKSTYFDGGAKGPMINAKLSPGEVISNLISDITGIPISGWNDPAKFDGNAWKTAGTIWSYAEKFIPDPVTGRTSTSELLDVAFGKARDTKLVKDVIDFVKDTVGFAKDTVDFTGGYLRTGVS